MKSFSRWMQPNSSSCPVCGSQVRKACASDASPIPIRHPGPRSVLLSLCGGCREAIPWIASPICRVCGRPEICGDCERLDVRHYEVCRSAVRYNSAMKEWLALYKYRGREVLEPVMAAMLAFAYEQLQRDFISRGGMSSSQPIVTSVPLARERLEDRGFNQAERMAVRLAGWYGLAYSPLLKRLFHTEKQSLKDRRSRTSDMRGIFMLDESFSTVEGAAFLLVDDIYTTGSTINECARILRTGASHSNGDPLVLGLQWARS
ncbi:ComF family protein [Cohnella sp.]|uniref:ComF family protein n=1 Tax=Cohnella sp. TaxID=1883426 RepID=UPI003563A825